MKRSRLMEISVFLILLLISNCEKSRETGKTGMEIAKDLVRILNKVPGLNIQPANMMVESTEKEGYLITLKEPAIDFDISQFDMGIPIKDTKIPVKLKEVVFKYDPAERYLELLSFRDFFMEGNFPGLSGMTMKISMEKAVFKNYDISPLLDKKTKTLSELMSLFLQTNQALESAAEHMTYEITVLSTEQKKISYLLDIEKIESRQKALSDIFVSLYTKEHQLPDMTKVLTRGKSLIDLEMKTTSLKLTVKEFEKVLGSGTVDHMFLSYFLKPDDTNSFFIYGFNWDIKNLQISVPGNREIEIVGDIPQWGMNFSLENLSAAFVKAYLDLTKKNLEMSASMDKEKRRQHQMMMGLTIASEFMKSKPSIKCTISPFKHHWGELEGGINFKFLNLMAPPVGKAIVYIPNVKEIENKIKEEKLLSKNTKDLLMTLMKKYIQVDEDGNGSITLETISDQPGTFFLNGEPIK